MSKPDKPKKPKGMIVFKEIPLDCVGDIAEFLGGGYFLDLRLVCKRWDTVVYGRYKGACDLLLECIKKLEKGENLKMEYLSGDWALCFEPTIDPAEHHDKRWNEVNSTSSSSSSIISFSIFPQFRLTYETYMEKKKYHRAFLCLSHEMCCKTCGKVVVPRNFRDLEAVEERYNTKEPHADIVKMVDNGMEYAVIPLVTHGCDYFSSHCLCPNCKKPRVFCEVCLVKHCKECQKEEETPFLY